MGKRRSDEVLRVSDAAVWARGIRDDPASHAAAAIDANAASLERTDQQRRRRSQAVYIDILVASGGLRQGLSKEMAADTYAALANPQTYAFFVDQLGWTSMQFEGWLADALVRLLLP